MERSAEGLKLTLGSQAPYFSLKGTDSRIHTISDFAGSPLVVIFTCNHCPYAQAYEGRILQIAKEYLPQGVKFIAICSNDSQAYPEDSFEHMIEKSKTLQIPFPYLHDDSQIVAKAYDAACTPESYVFDKNHKLVYHGRIDDNYREPSNVERRELAEAIEAVVQGKSPSVQMTPAIGCSIKWRK